MADPIPEIESDPKAALASYIKELEEYYYEWYDRATSRNFIFLSIAQALALLSGFATALIAALLSSEQFKGWALGRILVIVVPLIGSLASTFLVQSRIAELEALRESGRQTIQRLTTEARVGFAAASTPEQYTALHRSLIAEISDLEEQQSRGFQRLLPKAFSFTRRLASPRR